jgi:hypothetical protein
MYGQMWTQNFLLGMTCVITCGSFAYLMQNSLYNICPEAFAATEFSNILSSQLRQDVKILQTFRDCLCPHCQGTTDDLMPCCLVYIPLCGQRLGWKWEPFQLVGGVKLINLA